LGAGRLPVDIIGRTGRDTIGELVGKLIGEIGHAETS